MDSLQLKLCDIQGRLFELSAQQGYDSEKFGKRIKIGCFDVYQ